MVELKVSIEKKHIWLLALLIVAVSYVIAVGGVSHSTDEIADLDTKVNSLIDQKMSALQGKDIVEWKDFYVETVAESFTEPNNKKKWSLASYSNVYGANRIIGCWQAMNVFCTYNGYHVAINSHPTCGWAYNQDEACTNKPGCNLVIQCLRTAQ